MPFSLLSADGQSKYDVRDGAPMLVGRAPTCDVPVFDPTVSRRHAELSLAPGGVKVTDLGSANGTFVNGEEITGDRMALGRVTRLDDLFPEIVKSAQETLSVDRVAILLIDEHGNLITKIAQDKRGAEQSRAVPQSIAKQAVQDKNAILTDNAGEDTRFAQ